MSDPSHPADTSADTSTQPPENLVVLTGDVSRPPSVRELPDGSSVVQFDVDTTVVDHDRALKRPVPVAWYDPGPRERALLDGGNRLVVVGTVQRRFFRVGGQTQSRTEVVACDVVPVTRRTTLGRLLADVAGRVSPGAG